MIPGPCGAQGIRACTSDQRAVVKVMTECAPNDCNRHSRRGPCSRSTCRTQSHRTERDGGGVADLIVLDAGERSDGAVASTRCEVHPVRTDGDVLAIGTEHLDRPIPHRRVADRPIDRDTGARWKFMVGHIQHHSRRQACGRINGERDRRDGGNWVRARTGGRRADNEVRPIV